MPARRTWKGWLELELVRLEALRLEGRTAVEIAQALGRTPASIKNRLAQEGIRYVRAQASAQLAVLYRPHTIQSAAIELGVSRWAVKQAKRKLRRAGFDVPNALGHHAGHDRLSKQPDPPSTEA